jgi:1-pyrroline-5-carboxylate dehydrogenase
MQWQKNLKLTYATMFNPPEELHTRFEEALGTVKAKLGQEYGMIINNKDCLLLKSSKIILLPIPMLFWGCFKKGARKMRKRHYSAARKAFPCLERNEMARPGSLDKKSCGILLMNRTFTISAALAMEVGKKPHGSNWGV